jgi:hypothetical protein
MLQSGKVEYLLFEFSAKSLKILFQPIVIWIGGFEGWVKLKIPSEIYPPLMAIVNCDKTWRSQGEKTKQTLNFKKSILP